MDPEDMSSFHPISNLQFISKTIERFVSPQLVDHLMENKIYPNLQLARFGICDTALSGFRSYLTSQIQYVKINGKASMSTPLL